MKINYRKLLSTTAVVFLVLTSTSVFGANDVEQVMTEHAPKAIGPYSQAVRAGRTLYVSGQIALDPKTGKLNGQTIEEQTKQVLKNIEAILIAQGLTFENVVRSEVFLKDLSHFQAMNTIYGEQFSKGIKPARLTIQAAKLPMDALVEIVCTAYIPE